MSAHDRLDRIESKLATTTDAPILTDQERAQAINNALYERARTGDVRAIELWLSMQPKTPVDELDDEDALPIVLEVLDQFPEVKAILLKRLEEESRKIRPDPILYTTEELQEIVDFERAHPLEGERQ